MPFQASLFPTHINVLTTATATMPPGSDQVPVASITSATTPSTTTAAAPASTSRAHGSTARHKTAAGMAGATSKNAVDHGHQGNAETARPADKVTSAAITVPLGPSFAFRANRISLSLRFSSATADPALPRSMDASVPGFVLVQEVTNLLHGAPADSPPVPTKQGA
jgi:hypothetical protein